MTAIQTSLGFGSFRDFAAEKSIGREDVKIFALSLHSSSSDCGKDCHAVVAVGADGVEHTLGEVTDAPSEEMNAEIARRINEAGI